MTEESMDHLVSYVLLDVLGHTDSPLTSEQSNALHIEMLALCDQSFYRGVEHAARRITRGILTSAGLEELV